MRLVRKDIKRSGMIFHNRDGDPYDICNNVMDDMYVKADLLDYDWEKELEDMYYKKGYNLEYMDDPHWGDIGYVMDEIKIAVVKRYHKKSGIWLECF